ncbi:family S53 protease-like protein [Favolaschia claudopus]|uniref:tripeptidyl-peptidase II n=1 Tax=Favolaschia claudopus TaxID=2862362 RepID=A0AAV9Z983_9AGAR
MFFSPSLALVFLTIVAASPSSLVLHEHRARVPPGFTNKGRVFDGHMLTLRFALASNNIAGLQDKLLSISTPGSRDFRQWLSQDEVNVKEFMAPSSDTINAFNTFASVNGLKPSIISPNGDWLSVTLPVSKANNLFGTAYTNFTHADLPAPIIRTLSISLPAELAGHVQVIHPSTAFTAPIARRAQSPSMPKHKRDATAPADCDTSDPTNNITPACLQSLYNIPATPATHKNNTLLVTGYVEEWAEVDDLQAFLKQFRPDLPSNQTFVTSLLDGGSNPQGPGIAGPEADLDVQYAAGIASGVPLQFLSVGTFLSDFPASVLDTTTFLASAAQLPTVVTTSYGLNEEFWGASLATDSIKSEFPVLPDRKVCDAFAGISARGVSFLFSSGDGGVSGNHDDGVDCGLFVAVFPASCPWVTTVGSTIGFNPEVAVNFTGNVTIQFQFPPHPNFVANSGGFSSIFPTPPYQTTAISNFLKTLPPSFPGNGKFNATNRAYPDLSLQGWNFLINVRGEVGQTAGTSASTPSVAGMVALINDRLISEGKPVLGFLNPFLYGNAGAFNDVVKGHNSGFRCPASSVAFDAGPGWDPVSGLGTPNFPDLLAAALA